MSSVPGMQLANERVVICLPSRSPPLLCGETETFPGRCGANTTILWKRWLMRSTEPGCTQFCHLWIRTAGSEVHGQRVRARIPSCGKSAGPSQGCCCKYS
jgi:hypothetical protein